MPGRGQQKASAGGVFGGPSSALCTERRPHPAPFSLTLAPRLGTAAWHPIAGEKRRRRESLHTRREPQASTLLIKPLPDKTQTLADGCGCGSGSQSVDSCRSPCCLASRPGPLPAPTLADRPLGKGGEAGRGAGSAQSREASSSGVQGAALLGQLLGEKTWDFLHGMSCSPSLSPSPCVG